MLAYLRTIENGLDDISVKRIINVPKRGIGLTTIDRITSYAIEHELIFTVHYKIVITLTA